MKAKVCVDCFTLTPGLVGARCNRCQTTLDCARNRSRVYADPAERQRMKAVTDAAKANPDTICFLCGHSEPPEIYKDGWTADHQNPADKQSPLQPAHLGCNSARGNKTVRDFRLHLLDRLPAWRF